MSEKTLSLGIRVTLNSGMALLIYIASFFGLLWMVQHHEAVERVYPVASAALTGAFAGFLVKRASQRKGEVELAKIQLANGTRKEDPLT